MGARGGEEGGGGKGGGWVMREGKGGRGDGPWPGESNLPS